MPVTVVEGMAQIGIVAGVNTHPNQLPTTSFLLVLHGYVGSYTLSPIVEKDSPSVVALSMRAPS
jgi:hypothetical protein